MSDKTIEQLTHETGQALARYKAAEARIIEAVLRQQEAQSAGLQALRDYDAVALALKQAIEAKYVPAAVGS